jgi:hypothetical protein
MFILNILQDNALGSFISQMNINCQMSWLTKMILKMEGLQILIHVYIQWRFIVDLNLLLLNSGTTKSWSDTWPLVMLREKSEF